MDQKIKDIIAELSDRTEKKVAVWNRFSSSEQFYIKLKTATLKIDRLTAKDKSIVYQVAIVNDKGDVIYNFNAFKTTSPEEFNLLKEFHQKVKRAYFKVEETIEGLFDEIKKTEGEIGQDDSLPF